VVQPTTAGSIEDPRGGRFVLGRRASSEQSGEAAESSNHVRLQVSLRRIVVHGVSSLPDEVGFSPHVFLGIRKSCLR
jgi:hypothetical protein